MEDTKVKVNIDDNLYLNTYNADTLPHLTIKDQKICDNCKEKICTFICPARVYECKDGHVTVCYEGCLECGACRIICPYNNIDWNFPRGGFGIQFRLA
ncbi:ferredoxin like protein [Clostridium algifaecis]|uniref:Ferredoxin-like protein n=1 Tax=Clostridium algifaecis TaxID=1472040 RepID=A0ABS4KNV4_9CLOT|nr:4Fe-4S dicluster domain-containing protein [Clostridium algifaecis]MBP2031727.1 ferredoxin like protein [Clostridium algifaecis]